MKLIRLPMDNAGKLVNKSLKISRRGNETNLHTVVSCEVEKSVLEHATCGDFRPCSILSTLRILDHESSNTLVVAYI